LLRLVITDHHLQHWHIADLYSYRSLHVDVHRSTSLGRLMNDDIVHRISKGTVVM
jgi:hypothetical protein